jgi:hypothetical protein
MPSLKGPILVLAALAIAAAAGANSHTSPAASEVGKKTDAKWTATTYEAATAEANKKVLAAGKPASVTGEVVDVSCYLQLGKRGEAHIPCGTKCITNGQPIGLLDAKGDLWILFAEEHHPRRDGQVTLKDTFLPLLAKQATVSGMATNVRGSRALFVHAAQLAGSTAAPESGK